MRPYKRNPIPDHAAGAMGIVLLAVLVAVGAYSIFGTGPIAVPSPGAIAGQVQLRFEDRPDGTVAVIDAANDQQLAILARGEDGFIRTTMRGLARARTQAGIGPSVPFVLTRHVDGDLTLADPAMHQVIHLRAFGPTNEQAFGRLLAAGASAPGELAVSEARGPATTADRLASTDQG